MNLSFVSKPVAYLLIAGFGAAAYFNSFDVPFQFDDYRNIPVNANLHVESISPLALWHAGFGNPTPRPVANISFALNYYFGGDNVWGYHLINLLIHLICGVFVFEIGKRVLERIDLDPKAASAGNIKHGVAIFAALLFVLHPVQTQAVTYIVQRMASLCVMFYLAAVLAFLLGRITTNTSVRNRWWGLGIACWLFALGSKQMAVTLPLAVLLLEWILFQSGDHKWLRKQTRLFLLIGIVTLAVAFAYKGTDLFRLFTVGYERRSFTMVERLLTQGRVMVHYLGLIAAPLPSRLTLVYEYPVSTSLFTPITTLICWGAIIGSIGWAIWNAARYQLLSLAVLWYFIHLVVESTIVPLELVYEHRLYLPIVMACLFVADAVFYVVKPRPLATGLAITILGLLLAGTHIRNETWRSERTLWEDNIAKQPMEARAYLNLGKLDLKDDRLESARRRFDKSIELQPTFHQAYIQRAILNEQARDASAALQDYNLALSVPPTKAFGFGDYSIGYARRGSLLRRKGDFQGAIEDCTRAIQTNPGFARAYLERAMAHVFKNSPQLAVNDFRAAIKIDPDFVDAYSRFAWFLATHPDDQVANAREALKFATRACELTEWQDAARLGTLAAAHARLGQFEEAVNIQQRCLEKLPPNSRKSMTGRLELYKQQRPLVVNYNKPQSE